MVLAIGLSVYTLVTTGQFKTINPTFNGLCANVPGIVGAEDILIHPSGEYAFVSSFDRRLANAGTPAPGAIYRYDLVNSDVDPMNLTPDATHDFMPLGLSFHQDNAGQETLMVINRRSFNPSKDFVNQIISYDWSNQKLKKVRTIEEASLIAPNDLVAVDHDRFYFTNDHKFVGGFLGAIEAYFPLPVGTVDYFDGKAVRGVAEGFQFANGINKSPDGSKIYVTETVGQTLSVFNRNIESGELTLQSEVDLGTGPDNITLDDQGNLWIAAHPQLLTYVGFVSDETKYTPSQIIRLVPGIGGQLIPENVMIDVGDLVSGASVAAAIGNRFLIGGAYEKKFLDCSL